MYMKFKKAAVRQGLFKGYFLNNNEKDGMFYLSVNIVKSHNDGMNTCRQVIWPQYFELSDSSQLLYKKKNQGIGINGI